MGNSHNKKSNHPSQENLIYKKKFSKTDDENYKEYFKLIGLKLRKFYEENQNNQLNISLSLDKKDFNTIMTAKKIMINPTQKFIYWRDFLLEYLNKQSSKGYQWASELFE
jgi:hypothetical protein